MIRAVAPLACALAAVLGVPSSATVSADAAVAASQDSLFAAEALRDDECSASEDGGADCALNALQLRGRRAGGTAAEAAAQSSGGQVSCHDVKENEVGACLNAINWAKNEGYPKHPEWYPGLDGATATLADWQLYAWNTTHPTCPRPCTAKAAWDNTWCNAPEAPTLWAPATSKVHLKVLSYNLFWWNLFKQQGGRSADILIRTTGSDEHYDVIGLQECEDPEKVFNPEGLQDVYTSFQGSMAVCMAYRTDKWDLLEKGEDEVAMDMRTEYYGHRIAQWMRLQDKTTGTKVMFVNHHGPLHVNSGGACGGFSTAHNLLKVMATHGQVGDVLVLVGDFNANAASQTVQHLWTHLTHVYNSVSFGGVDNIFSNLPKAAVVQTNDLGTGGSDHHAISAVLALPVDAARAKEVADDKSKEPFAVQTLENALGNYGCMMEPNSVYAYPAGSWGVFKGGVIDPRACCDMCHGQQGCSAWSWEEWNENAKGPLCSLRQGSPTSKVFNDGAVSGFAKSLATAKALVMSAEAGANAAWASE